MAKLKVKYALDTVSVRERGSKYPTQVHKGTAWHADYPLVVDHPDLFADNPTDVLPRGWQPPPAVEQASAAPGELRTARRPSNG
jgi:hypothetical protein